MPDDAAPGQPPRYASASAAGPAGTAAPKESDAVDWQARADANEAALKEAAARENGLVKVSMNLSHQTVEVLRELSRKSGTTMTEVVRRSIGLQKFAMAEIDAGGKLLVEDADGTMKRVLLP